MFDTFFEFKYINKTEMNGACAIHLYRLDVSSSQTIMVEVHEFVKHPICIIKFYDRDDRNSDNRFTKLTNKGHFLPIFRTCINIMVQRKRLNQNMSFAFIGAQTPEEKAKGETARTQRYRIYEHGMNQYFSNANFRHHYLEEHSLYILFNRAYCNNQPNIELELLKCIQEIYPEEPLWEHLL